MCDSSPGRTPVSLLGRLRLDPNDPTAWKEFLDRYGVILLRWGENLGLQRADAEDVAQTVLFALVRKLPLFRYDPSRRFRGWLYTIVRNEVRDFSRRQLALRGSGDSQVHALLAQAEAPPELVEGLIGEFERMLFAEACARVRLRIDPQTWEIFRLRIIDKVPGSEIAARLDVPINTVFSSASRVFTKIKRECKRLEQQELGHGELSPG